MKLRVLKGTVVYRIGKERFIRQRGDVFEVPDEVAAKISPSFIEKVPEPIVEPQIPQTQADIEANSVPVEEEKPKRKRTKPVEP